MEEPKQEIVKADQLDTNRLMMPLSSYGVPRWAVYFFSLLGFIYILNPTLGVLELIPDAFPIVGNLDEGAAALMLWYGLVEFFEARRYRTIPPAR